MQESKEIQAVQPSSNDQRRFLITGALFLSAGLLLFLWIYHDVIALELSYRLFPPDKNAVVLNPEEKGRTAKAMRPIDEKYGIVIPKIGANARVIADVSPYNEKEYQIALTKGVAQAQGTTDPGSYGNVFIFAHSAANLNLANRYNAVFYLLNKMEKNDRIFLFYKEHKYQYQVTDTRIVTSDALEYLKQDRTKQELTLMTCWPPGTTLRRLVVRAQLVQ